MSARDGRGMKNRKKSFSPGRHHQQTQVRLLAAGALILAIVGGSIVWLFYGGTAFATAMGCLAAAAGVFGLLWLILSLMERWVKDDDL